MSRPNWSRTNCATQPSRQSQHRTRGVRAGIDRDPTHGAIIPPVYLSSNYSFEALGQPRTYDYTRSGNPTRDELGQALADLENGAGAIVTSTGMSAVLLALQLVPCGARILAPFDCYGGTFRLLRGLQDRNQLKVEWVNQSDEGIFRSAVLEYRPQLIWVETPSNPLLRITDLQVAVELAREVGALLVVDNTFLSPALQRPIDFGADVVVHSTTKYINGHSDVVGGAVVVGKEELVEPASWWANCLGITGAPWDSYLTLRGLRTLHARLDAHERNANAVAQFLFEHPRVGRVYYPGLSGHPGHAVARHQQAGFGGMVSFELEGGQEAVSCFVERLRCFSLAESLGGVESLVCHPATMTHAAMTEEARTSAGIGDGLLRLSVGIESPEDLLADLSDALDQVARRELTPAPVPTAGGVR